MSTQSFSDTFREALWITYEQKCYYHKGHIEFKAMEIDHVVPESLLTSTNLVAELAARGLPPTFNILGEENLVPSCHGCNSAKSDNPLEFGLTGIILAEVKKNIPKLQKEKKRAEVGVKFGYIEVRLENLLKKGLYSKEEIKARLQKKGIIDFITSIPIPVSTNALKFPGRRIIVSDQAAIELGTNKYLLETLLYAIEHGNGAVYPVARAGGFWEFKARRGERVLFKVSENEILIVAAFKDKQEANYMRYLKE